MKDYNRLVEILNKYGLNGQKIVQAHKDTAFIPERIYDEIDQILSFLINKKIEPEEIEKYFSSICTTTLKNIEDNYEFLINQTELKLDNFKHSLKILTNRHQDLKDIYKLIKELFGIKFLQFAINILARKYQDITSIIGTVNDLFGNLNIISQNGAVILYKGNAEEIPKIMSIPQLGYNKDDKSYNKDLVSAKLISSTYENVKDTLGIKLSDITGNVSDEKINLWDHPKYKSLLSSTIWIKSAEQVKEILRLEYWDYPEYQNLLTPSIWYKDAEQIKGILNLKYWQDPDYKQLLTPSIWLKECDQIEDILSLNYWKNPKYKHLLTSSIWHKNANQVIEILNLEYWNEPQYEHLLTPSVWTKTASQITDILNLEYWQDPKYQPLLTSSMWRKSANQIRDNIEICENNGLEDFSNERTLIYGVSSRELLAKINYLKSREKPLYTYDKQKDEYKLHPIFGMSNKDMQARYGITKKELITKYQNYSFEEESKHVL